MNTESSPIHVLKRRLRYVLAERRAFRAKAQLEMIRRERAFYGVRLLVNQVTACAAVEGGSTLKRLAEHCREIGASIAYHIDEHDEVVDDEMDSVGEICVDRGLS